MITYNLNYKAGSIHENIERLVKKEQPDVLATGGLTAQYWQLKEIIDAACAAKPDIVIWVGGGIITSSLIPVMEALETADYGMIGEDEITVCELAEAMKRKWRMDTDKS